MANIKKSFNFRNGVQVDDDNLKVSATGLVGIGTTVPTEALDVRGNLVVSGVSSAVTAQAGVLTVTTLNPTEIIGAGISIKSGIVTASSGIITFYGDGINLLNLPTSQWEDTIVGAGVSSIYNTGGNVGIATTAALFTLQVGNDVNSGQKGVGISSFGDIKVSGIITATNFSGNLTGDVTGDVLGTVTGNINSGLATITQINATNINVSGLSTFAGITSVTGPILHSNQLDVSGISTMRGGISIPFSNGQENLQIGFVKNNLIDVTGIASIGTRLGNQDLHLSGGGVNPDSGRGVKVHSDLYLLKQLDVTGASTFRNQVSIQQGSGGITLSGLSGSISASGLVRSSDQVKGDDGVLTNEIQIGQATIPGVIGHPRLIRTSQNGPLRLAGYQSSGVEVNDKLTLNGINPEALFEGSLRLTQDSNNNLAKIGVGTISPANDIQVRRFTGNAEIQVTSDTGIAALTVGRETGTGDTNNAEFRYGGGSGTPYSSAQSLDILNYGTGNFNYHLSANNAGAAAGDFHWHKGKNNARLMTLTNTGRLGIGVTQPTEALDVGGNVKIRGTTIFDDIVTIQGGLNVAAGSLSVSTIAADITGNLTGNVNATSGLSTFFNIKVTDPNNNFAGIGIKTDNTGNLPLDIFGDGASTSKRLFVTDDARVGIKTDVLMPGIDINAVDSRVVIQSMGVGTTNPQSAVDMRFAGQELTGIFANRMYMYPPQVTATQRGNLAGVAAGALIYNTSTNKLQVYNGSAWQDCN